MPSWTAWYEAYRPDNPSWICYRGTVFIQGNTQLEVQANALKAAKARIDDPTACVSICYFENQADPAYT